MGGSDTRLTLARITELDRSVFAEIIASLLQVISQISQAPYAGSAMISLGTLPA